MLLPKTFFPCSGGHLYSHHEPNWFKKKQFEACTTVIRDLQIGRIGEVGKMRNLSESTMMSSLQGGKFSRSLFW